MKTEFYFYNELVTDDCDILIPNGTKIYHPSDSGIVWYEVESSHLEISRDGRNVKNIVECTKIYDR